MTLVSGAAETSSPVFDVRIIIIVVLGLALLILLLLLFRRREKVRDLNRRLDRVALDAREHVDSIASSADLILTQFDGSGRCIQIGPGVERITGVPTNQLLENQQCFIDCVHPTDRTKLRIAEEKRVGGLSEPLTFTYRLKGSDNRWHWLSETQTPVIVDGAVRGFEAVTREISDRVRFEQQQRRLLDLERLSTTFLESFLVTDDVPGTSRIMLDVLGRYFDFSGAKILERTSDESSFQVSFTWRHERHRDEPMESLPDSIDAERIAWWIEQVRGGIPFPIAPDGDHSSEETAVHMITGAEAILVVPVLVLGRLHMMIVLEDQDEQRSWQPEELAAIQTMSHGMARSIERNIAEQNRVEFAEYRRLIERTEIIGQLASGIAHDFNNILFAVSGRTQLLLRHTQDEKIREGLKNIENAMADAKGIIGTLRVMNNQGSRATGSVRIANETRRVTEMISRLIPNRVELSSVISLPNDVEAICPPDALHQVVMNLVINARDAVDGQGRIRITVEEDSDSNLPILLMVEDDGPGIPEDRRTEVLKPFISTKPQNLGSGLGLSIVKKVVENCMGRLELSQSELGGLKACVRFQRGELSEPVAEGDSIQPNPTGDIDFKRVCVIEDDEVIRELISQFFRSEGVETILLPDATRVESVLSDPGTPIDILVMDIDLPRMTGIECLERLRKNGCDIPCVLMTGGLSEAPSTINGMQLLRKPFAMSSLNATCSVLVNEHRFGPSNDD